MFTNETRWGIFTAANNVSQSHAIDSPSGGLVEGLSGGVVAVAFLIGIIIAVRKNLAFVQGVLEQILSILTLILNAMRKWLPTTPPPPLQTLPPPEI